MNRSNFLAVFLFVVLSFFTFSGVSPSPLERSTEDVSSSLQRRTDPVFPPTPSSCPICEAGYSAINSCPEAAPLFANFTMVLFNPGAFIDVIKCGCTDAFQSAFPQCVDCFTKTGQTAVFNTSNLPTAVDGMRQVCSLASAVLGGVASSQSSASSRAATASSAGGGVAATPVNTPSITSTPTASNGASAPVAKSTSGATGIRLGTVSAANLLIVAMMVWTVMD